MAGNILERQNNLRTARPIVLSEAELAVRWGISRRTLQRWRRDGIGPRWLRLNGRILYRQGDIDLYEAKHLEGAF